MLVEKIKPEEEKERRQVKSDAKKARIKKKSSRIESIG